MTKLELDLRIVDYLNGTLSEQDEKDLLGWVNSSEKNRTYFAETVALWELSSTFNTEKKYRSERAWKKLSSRITPAIRYHYFLREFAKLAAVFVLAFLVINAVQYYQAKATTTQQIINEVPRGSISKVTLPDGTSVWLNAESKLSYDQNFGKEERQVSLSGEAFFEVSTNPSKPFIVEARGIAVKATGTQFNIRAYDEEDLLETTLVEGKVSVNKTEGGKHKDVKLLPNQKITVYFEKGNSCSDVCSSTKKEPKTSTIKKVEIVSDIKTILYTSWKDKDWIIYKEKLGALAEKLERRYNANITFLDQAVEDYAYSGTLRDETLEQVLHIIARTSPIEYKIDKKNITIWNKHAS